MTASNDKKSPSRSAGRAFLPQSLSDCGVEIAEHVHYSVFLVSAFFMGAAFIALGFQKSGSALIQFSSM
jgi:hypothetical protein